MVPEIDLAAESYCEARDERMLMAKEEIYRAEKLSELMKKHGLASYKYDGKLVTLKSLEKISVRKEKKEPADGDE